MAGAFLFASCVEEAAPLANTISADRAEVVLGATESKATYIEVKADGEWVATSGSSDDWFTFSPASGSGNGTITIIADSNLDEYKELAGPRKGTLTILGKESMFTVTIKQGGENGLDASRTYTKITTDEDIEAGKSYLIVTNTGSELAAAAPFDEPAGRYTYISPQPVEAEGDVIVRPNASLGVTFVEKGEGYALQMSNGKYLYQGNDTYTSFYCTSDIEEADVWSVTAREDGTYKIVNTLKMSKTIQYSIQYGTYGSYPEPDENSPFPSLYKDSAAPSDEVLTVAEEIKIGAFETTVSIPVTSNKSWTVRNHDSWVKSFTKSGNGDGTIQVELAGVNGGEERTATFTVIGKTTSTVVKLVQASPMNSIAEVNEWITNGGKSYEVSLTDAVVTYVSGSNAYIEDATGGILLYKYGHGLEVGNKINGKVSGYCELYSKLPELTSIDYSTATVESGATLPCTELTIEELLNDFNRYMSCRVLLSDVDVTATVNLGDRDGEIAQGGKTLALRAQNKYVVITEGSKGSLICYPSVYNSNQQLAVWNTDDFDVTFLGTLLTVNTSATLAAGDTFDLEAEANVEATITYSSDNEAVATVSAEGVVTAVAEGTANITISIAGTDSYSAAEKTCAVKVTSPEYEWVLKSGDLGAVGSIRESVTMGTPELTWAVSGLSEIGYIGFDSSGKGVQMGSSNKPLNGTMSLQTTATDLTVTKIILNAAMASKGDTKVSVYVNGTQVGTAQAVTTTATDYTFTLDAAVTSPVIKVEISNTVKAAYLKSILFD